jgi:SAM-dependent methyltransferase
MSSDLNAYEGVESLHNFNEQSFKLYCENKTLECEKHLAFIRQFINKTFVGSVMEVGSGNGKLLYALERDGFISEAIGYELSSSRVHFANKFGELVGSKKVKNICGDFTKQEIEVDSVDLIVAVDLVIQLISASDEKSEMIFFEQVFSALKPGAILLLELMDFSNLIQMYELNNNIQLWKEFNIADPWQYGLDDYVVKGMDIMWDKKFISRDRTVNDTSFQNILRQYTFDIIKEKLCSVGFMSDDISKFEYWNNKGDILNDEFIVLATK